MDMDNSVGIDCGTGVWAGQRRERGEGGNWDSCNGINKNLKNDKSSDWRGQRERIGQCTQGEIY